MKTVFKTLAPILVLLFVASCSKDDTPIPSPQVTPDKTSIATVTNASEIANLAIVAPGGFSTVIATADKGIVSVSKITGVGSAAGTAEVDYVAPDATGTYNITITVTDQHQKTGTATISVVVSTKPPVTLAAGDISGVTFVSNTTYLAQGSLLVPAGKSVTIPEGVYIIFDGDGTQGAAEFAVSGNLYVLGTKAKPVFFTIPEAKRTTANIFKGLWGGVQATTTAGEVVLKYANIEYAGAPAGAANTSVLTGAYTAGTLRYGLLISNNTGKFVMQYSRIAYTQDDAMRITGGTLLVHNNLFETVGSTGGEAVNIKSGCTGDVAYNVVYSAATNGMKISNVSGSAPTPQANINTYNNTIIFSGYRQTSTTAHGGSINYEKGIRGQVYNNIIANCKFGTRLTSDADVVNCYVGYNFHFGSEQGIVDQFYPTSGVLVGGTNYETNKDVNGTLNTNDPKFVNFALTPFSSTNAASTSNPTFLATTSDFHLQAGSPAIGKGKTFTPGIASTVGGVTTYTTSVTAGGVTYPIPAPSTTIGAYGTN